MAGHMAMASPRIDEAFLNQVVNAALAAKDVIMELSRLSPESRERLLSQDPATAREAARDLMRTYFGTEDE